MSRRSTALVGAAVVGAALGLAGCSQSAGSDAGRPGASSPPVPSAGSSDLSIAVNDTRTDSVYPEVGNPLVDALHYDLDLTWDPDRSLLTGEETLVLRATDDADRIPLDFSSELEISAISVGGEDAAFEHSGDDLLIEHAVETDERVTVEISYAGTPQPTPAPSKRSDFGQGLGWSTTPENETWTLQEPFGAFTWYAVNDHPSDKALYDFTLSVAAPWAGVANGALTSDTQDDGQRTTTWHLAEPASSYLVTVAFGDFQVTELASASGVPIQIWADADTDPLPGDTEYAVEAMAWLEDLLGPYPFDTFGIVVVDNNSGMETQTMVTLGDSDYSLSAAVVVHELAHHWYGNSVSPNDWSEVWMNEGLVMYLQGMWEAEQEGISVARKMDQWASFEGFEREEAGPPAAYDPDHFAAGNVYYGPALMWHELRERLGDEEFFAMVRAWPEEKENDTAGREEYWSWIEEETGEELTRFFEEWLLGRTTPAR